MEVTCLGCDVSHPPPSVDTRPSVASVVASVDPRACFYTAKIEVQPPHVEIIQNLGEMVWVSSNFLQWHFAYWCGNHFRVHRSTMLIFIVPRRMDLVLIILSSSEMGSPRGNMRKWPIRRLSRLKNVRFWGFILFRGCFTTMESSADCLGRLQKRGLPKPRITFIVVTKRYIWKFLTCVTDELTLSIDTTFASSLPRQSEYGFVSHSVSNIVHHLSLVNRIKVGIVLRVL